MANDLQLPGAGKFGLALLFFGIVYFLLPPGAQPWFAVLIVMGALVYAGLQPGLGPLEQFASWFVGPYQQTYTAPPEKPVVMRMM